MLSKSQWFLLIKDRQVRILTAALILGALSTLVFGGLYWQAQSQHDDLTERNEALIENIGQLRLLDETLTMSAKMAAASDDPKYEELYKDRYKEAAAEYEQLVEDTVKLFPESDAKQKFNTTKQTADRPFELESRAFTLAHEGRDSEALDLLEGPEYSRSEQRYHQGLDSIFTALQDAQAQDSQRVTTYQTALIQAGFFGLGLVFLGWGYAIHLIIKRRQAEEARSRLASIVKNSTDAIDSESMDGTIISLNPSAEKLYGYSEDELKGKNISILMPPGRKDEIKEVLERVGRGETVSDYETERASKGGRRIPLSLTVSPVKDSDGRIVGASAIARDITERRLAEQELKQAKEAAEAASRAKSDFLANMSHEIRTPMNGVIGMTGLLLDTELNEEQREYAEVVRSSGENLLTIINDILDFSKIEAGKMDIEVIDFDLRATVEETVELLAERSHSKGLELASLVEYGVPTALRGDPGRIRQVLVNLLGNAVKFTEEGEVVLVVSLVEESGDVAIVRFEVKDTGMGMTGEQRSRLFQSFSQADASTTRKYGGTGLGLAISKQLVELMGGEMGVESEPGVGSTFFFTLPLRKQPENSLPAPEPFTDLGGLRVLVVDDNETNRKIVHHQIASWGMKNGSAGDGRVAIEMLRAAAERGEPYDLAILDMQMPEMNGLDLARQIKSDPSISSTRLIMLSSMGQRGEGEKARRAGIEAYLTKPVRQSQLYDALATIMGRPGQDMASEEALERQLITRHSLQEAKARARARILVAEDNQVNQKVAVKMLERLGYRADVAANGLEAVEALSRIPYPAVLMDVQMPEMDGYQATAEIRRRERRGRHTPIIAMTANAMRGDREKALDEGMDDYISKPVKIQELQAVLERWLPEEGGEKPRITPVPDPHDASTSSVDHSRLESLRELQEEDKPDILNELVEMFLKDAPCRLEALREAAGKGDATSMERMAHTLKGSCGSLGAARMAAICGEIEEMGRSGELAPAPAALSRLEEEFQRVRVEFERELSRS